MHRESQPQELSRYAQDLRALMEQYASLQQAYQSTLQCLHWGRGSEDLLLDSVLQPGSLYIVTDEVGEIRYASSAVARALCVTDHALVGQSIWQRLSTHPQCALQRVRDTLDDGRAPQAMLQCKVALRCTGATASAVMCDAWILRVWQQDQFANYWLLRRETHASASALEIQNDYWTAGEAQAAVMLVGGHGKISLVNAAFRHITGFGALDVLGESPRMLGAGHDDAAFCQSFWTHMEQEGGWSGETYHRRKNGQIYLARLSVREVHDVAGQTLSHVAVFADMSRGATSEYQPAKLAFHDPLTGLANRCLFEDRLSQAMAQACRTHTGLRVLYLDLDRFQSINDEMGYDLGNQVLQEVGARLRVWGRSGDVVARIGGDEFALMVHNGEADADLHPYVDDLLHALSQPIQVGMSSVRMGVSMACVQFPQDGADTFTLMVRADAAMYRAKRSSTRFCSYDAALDAHGQ